MHPTPQPLAILEVDPRLQKHHPAGLIPMAEKEKITANTDFNRSATGSGPGQAGPFELRVSLSGLAPEDSLRAVLPSDYARIPISQLLDRIFPEAKEQRREVASMFDLRANPDLPDIYAVFLDVFDEWRDGRCALSLSGDAAVDVDFADSVSQHLQPASAPAPDGSGFPLLDLKIEQRYRAIEYALRHGRWESKEELLGWLRSLTLLYFLDKHEVGIPVAPSSESDRALTTALEALRSKHLIGPSEETATFVITEEGRRFIGGLLAETESYIELYDHFKDTEIDLASDTIEFDSGRGIDLRVQAFLLEGLEPIRTMFLLRLYDGTLDGFISTWESLIHDEDFFDAILEPVVNRYDLDEALMGWTMENGYSYLEEREEKARELEAQEEILRRVSRS